MIQVDTEEIYYNTQVYFAKNLLNNLPNDDKIWAKEYRRWLYEQGCEIQESSPYVVRNGIGIAPGYDKFVFQDERLATLFILRWA